MPPRLPGFYYDETKKKYFKILGNHQAPEGASYTRDDVSRRKDKTAETKRATEMEGRVAKERVKRSPILTNPLYRVIEEIGYRYISPEELKDRRARQSVHYLEAKPLQTPQFPEENFHVLNLFRDPRYGTLIQVANHPRSSAVWITYPNSPGTTKSQLLTYDSPVRQWNLRLPTFEMTAAGLNGSGHLLLASSERVGFKLYVHKITEPDRIAATTTEDIHIDKPALVCRAIASERTGYIPDFAIASGEGLNYLKVTPTGYEFDACWGANGSGSGHRGRLRWTEKDTWAVDFITPNLIASGGAGAKVLLTDKRQSDTFSEGIIHTGPISDIKATGDYLAVSGPNGPGSQRAWGNNTIRLYDLRYRKEVNGQTVPYWKRESTFFITPLHFEVYPETGLLALVDRERVPRLLSLKDGTPVQSSISKSGGASRVKFDHCNGHLTLLVSTQWGEVAEYS